MENKRTLRDYLNEIKACEDSDRLIDKLKIYDNFPVLLYGDQIELFSKVTQAFRDSPEPEGIVDGWHHVRDLKDGMVQQFDYDQGTVSVQVTRDSHDAYTLGEKDRIDDVDHSIWISFHPYQKKKMRGVKGVRAMALAIADFGDYVIRENLTVRFPKANLNHISE